MSLNKNMEKQIPSIHFRLIYPCLIKIEIILCKLIVYCKIEKRRRYIFTESIY